LKKQLTIAGLGRTSGVGVETIRYYQRMGLLSVPKAWDQRSQRRYGPDEVAELRFVRECKALGLSIKEIAVLVQLRRSPGASCTKFHERLEVLRLELEAKKRKLEAQLGAVGGLLDSCSGGRPLSDCEAFRTLETRELAHEG
jgi:MerR family mercuric resistance operon transcriptional regulator